MTLTVARFLYPELVNRNTMDSHLLDAADEAHCCVFQAPKAGTIDTIGFLTQAVTTSATLDVRVETVGSDGNPTGTLWATNTNGSQGSLSTNTFYEVSLTAGATVVRGDFVAIVIVAPSGANLNVARLTASAVTYSFPYVALKTGGTWAKVTGGSIGVHSIRYSDTTYPLVQGVLPLTAATTDAYASTSTPDERGVKFAPSFACKVVGAWVAYGAFSDAEIRLYDNSSTLLASTVVDGDYGGSTTTRFITFDNEVTLTAGETYRLTVLATSATNFSLRRWTWQPSAATQMAGQAWGFQLTTRSDLGAWTDTANTRPQLGVIVSAVDDGAGSGGGGGGSSPFAYGFAS